MSREATVDGCLALLGEASDSEAAAAGSEWPGAAGECRLPARPRHQRQATFVVLAVATLSLAVLGALAFQHQPWFIVHSRLAAQRGGGDSGSLLWAGPEIGSNEAASADFGQMDGLPCGIVEVGVDILSRSDVLSVASSAASPEECGSACGQEQECQVWTWNQVSRTCSLKSMQAGADFFRQGNSSLVSGTRPCGSEHVPETADTERNHVLTCGLVEVDVDYLEPARKFATLHFVPTAVACSWECERRKGCSAWSWKQEETEWGPRQICSLKRLESGETPSRDAAPGVVSGSLPCKDKLEGQLFCWSLIRPHSYEQELLSMQASLSTSIFACDKFAVYSNEVLQIAPGIATEVVNSSLHCKYGIKGVNSVSNTALNTGIFLTVWKKLIADGHWAKYAWTVKVDPDCVFIASRLRQLLHHHQEHPAGVFLQSCARSLHGPVEALSHNAVRAWAAGMGRCKAAFAKDCNGDYNCGWGEDIWLGICLGHVLGVKRHFEWKLLSEDHCRPENQPHSPWGVHFCKEGAAAFHPFKHERSYLSCLKLAQSSAGDTLSKVPRLAHTP